MQKVIEVQNLTKKYGKLTAVDNLSFYVERGKVFGLLGENGAGKTTTLEMIEGLRKPTHGKIKVLGKNATRNINSVKERIGVQLQSSAYFQYLTLYEILDLFGSFYKKSVKPMELLKLVDLQDKAKSYVNKLSGGQKQRFSIIASLVNDPEVVFLDEPTTGLDPLARRNLWEIIQNINKQGKTVILTTHYMEEAEVLCDRIAIMDRGKMLVIGETNQLIEQAKYPFRITFILKSKRLSTKDKAIFKKIETCGSLLLINREINLYELNLSDKKHLDNALNTVHELNPDSFTVGKAKLEDLFIELTGKKITEDGANNV